MDRADLIAALEAAEGPSRELDWHIARATGHPSMEGARPDFFPPFAERSLADRLVPEYTRSLDAAMSLVPERAADGPLWRFILERKPVHSGPAWIAEIREHGKDAGWGIAHTGPLAVCAACLRALPEATREREA